MRMRAGDAPVAVAAELPTGHRRAGGRTNIASRRCWVARQTRSAAPSALLVRLASAGVTSWLSYLELTLSAGRHAAVHSRKQSERGTTLTGTFKAPCDGESAQPAARPGKPRSVLRLSSRCSNGVPVAFTICRGRGQASSALCENLGTSFHLDA
ncbi:hypothetical protein XACM_3443 [Xanthomonas euvesicatoria pv. citrumelo F1]|nr:hypothetical protein XACM_3443 [Xanthomonas euvesicatoria pv. citrumelo F1]